MIFRLGDFIFDEKHGESVKCSTDYKRGFNERLHNLEGHFTNQLPSFELEIAGRTVPRVDKLSTLKTLYELARKDEPAELTNALGEYFGRFVVLSIEEERASFLPNGAFLEQSFTVKLKKVED